ncbi:lytic transglycosylase domain-containing protein [Nafulsella turpanensis]|uniref:lytic transglycosylase domain-containing protein n=1 Tax=Nafulsella turpanensis TaxID=1265690 RepID=UPI001F447E04|nr:lytic transglycosylase domain-containing protein [Nafulsella turpanensis]
MNCWKAPAILATALLSVCSLPAFAQEEEDVQLSDTLQVYIEVERPFYEHVPDYTYEEVADRISCMDTDIDITFNPRVKAFIDYFAIRDREYTRMVIKRMNIYFPLFEKYLKKHNMPDDLKYLSIVESGLNPTAISHAGAAGLWQFMPATGRIFRLDRTWFIDERMDPEKATEAACKYLKQLHGMFDDWELALASYNAGPGNVRKAIRRSGYKDDFWEVYNHLPRETRSYVPQFAAITYLMNHLEEHNFHMEEHELQYATEVETVHLAEFISLEALEEELNLCKGEISSLNPELIRNAVPENVGDHYALKVPSQVAPVLTARRDAIYDSTREQNQQMLAYFTRNEVGSTFNREKVTYRVQRGDYLGKIAELHNVRVSDLRHWNRIQGNTIRIGQQLSIYVLPTQKASINNQLAQAGSSSSKAVSIQGAKVYYVQPGDTLWDISKKHGGLSINQIKQLNNLTSNDIKPGQKLVLSK